MTRPIRAVYDSVSHLSGPSLILPKGHAMRTAAIATLIVVAGWLVTPGCTAEQDAAIVGNIAQSAVEAREGAKTALEALEAVKPARDEITAAIDALPPGSEREAWIARGAAADKVLAVLTAAAEAAQASAVRFEEMALNPGATTVDLVEGGAQVVAPFLSPPWGAIAAGAIGLIAGLIRSWRQKQAALRMVKAIESAKHSGQIVDFAAPYGSEAAKRLRAMGPAALALVDEAQGKTRGLPF